MKKSVFLFFGLILIGFIILVGAADYSGDGTHTVQIGDIVTIDNSWKVEILGISMAHYGEQIKFRTYDSQGNAYPSSTHLNTLDKIEGDQKFGTEDVLKVEIEVLEVFGDTTPTGSQFVTIYENAKINIVSIDEALPGVVSSGSEDIEEVDKDLTYKDANLVSLSIGEETTLGNGYKLILDRFDQRWGSPYFSLYDSKDNMIDESLGVGKEVDVSLGSLIYVKDYTQDSVDLLVIEGSKLTFGTGWNMFSIHIEDGDGSGTILESTCNKAPMWVWDNELGDYEKVGVLEEGAKIPSGKGIWSKIQTKKNVQSDIDCEIIVSGTNSVTTKGTRLMSGWNLIGAPISAYGDREIVESGSNFNLLSFDDILGDCRLEKGPWQYLGTKYSHFNIKSEVADEHKFSEPFENYLRLNRGYFIKVIDDCTLSDK
jgi:hypothetical protein|tara:strand:- start:877 stop:2157 length:1281 start_codon:yes stop_codon:yes gene_type:complete